MPKAQSYTSQYKKNVTLTKKKKLKKKTLFFIDDKCN